MTYINKLILPSIGFIQASAVTSTTPNNVVMDIDNGMGTTVDSGKTDLKAQSVVVMTLSRDNDGIGYRLAGYVSDSTINDQRFYAVIKSHNSQFTQTSEYTFGYSNSIEPTSTGEDGSGTISFTNYSHSKIWRLST